MQAETPVQRMPIEPQEFSIKFESDSQSKQVPRIEVSVRKKESAYTFQDHLTFGVNGSESRTSITQGDDRISPRMGRPNMRFDFNGKLDSNETFGLPSNHGSPLVRDHLRLPVYDYNDDMASPVYKDDAIARTSSHKISPQFMQDLQREAEAEEKANMSVFKPMMPCKSVSSSPRIRTDNLKDASLKKDASLNLDESMPRFYQPEDSVTTKGKSTAGRDERPASIIEQSEVSSSATYKFEL